MVTDAQLSYHLFLEKVSKIIKVLKVLCIKTMPQNSKLKTQNSKLQHSSSNGLEMAAI
jgi:hypothetical protein